MQIKIATQMFPTERIEWINREANINGQLGVEVKLWGVAETFQYTGEFASLAYDILEGVEPAPAPPSFTLRLPDGDVLINDIVWADLAVNLNGQTGVEIRVATDPVGMTRQYSGEAASEAYDALVSLVPQEMAV